MGVEPIGNRKTCHPPVLKTGTVTGPHALPCCDSKGSENQTQEDSGALAMAVDGAELSRLSFLFWNGVYCLVLGTPSPFLGQNPENKAPAQ